MLVKIFYTKVSTDNLDTFVYEQAFCTLISAEAIARAHIKFRFVRYNDSSDSMLSMS